MSPQPRHCARCSQWRPSDRERDHRAACALYGHQPAFNDTCPTWQALPQPPASLTPPWDTPPRVYGAPGKKVS